MHVSSCVRFTRLRSYGAVAMSKSSFRSCCLLGVVGVVLLLALQTVNKSSFAKPPIKYAKLYGPVSSETSETLATPVRNFVFVKTHKTGSTSVRDILKRYIRSHGLIEIATRKGSPPMKNQFLEINNNRTYRVVHRPGEYNALVSHCRYRKSVADKLIRNPIYLTILRNPYTLFLSAFDFFSVVRQCVGAATEIGPLEVLDNPRIYYNKLRKCAFHWHILNPMAYDLGLEPPYDDKDVRSKIREMDEAFSLVMIMEHYPESIVMLRRILKWNLTDVVMMPARTHPNFKKNDEKVSDYEKLVAHHQDAVLTDRHKEVLRDWLRADFLIYNHFLKVFHEKIRDEERRTGSFAFEVERYKDAMVNFTKGKDIRSLPRDRQSQMAEWYEKKTA